MMPGPVQNQAVVFGRRLVGDEAKCMSIVDDSCTLDDLLPTAKSLLITNLGKNGIKRENLKNMKTDIYRNVVNAFNKRSKL